MKNIGFDFSVNVSTLLYILGGSISGDLIIEWGNDKVDRPGMAKAVVKIATCEAPWRVPLAAAPR